MGTPAADERVLWQGRPDLPVLARTAFHTRTVAIYFAGLVAISLVFGNTSAAIVCTVLGVAAIAILQGLAWQSARSTLYILTDARLIMRIGMAIETRINIPLKHIGAAHLNDRGKGRGDIALELNGERMLGNLLLWPHARPWKFTKPQPMLRAIPDAASVASMLSDACANFSAIERNLTEIKEERAGTGQQVNGPAAPAHNGAVQDRGFEGAPA
ncbi:PH domain-containing protein [Erythrobacter sp. WH131]|uniref:PH domain-containing protein n=2 Tax=Erythrobacter ani TaxID=2827235 RepID=A0ABS6SMX2_9SPHN|nr:photosynthetic complex putative assembly protein PuhB [Erythrobacter ani]MBV7266381.1 PH domain-containing protein [Erythrobacter ani]